jgi:hypothetical protein
MPADSPYMPALFERMSANRLLRMKSHQAIAIPSQTVKEARRWLKRAEIEEVSDESL